MNTTPDLSGCGAQVIEENGRSVLTFWPHCVECQSPFQFDAEEPFAHCSCGTTEWGDPRPASWVCPPRRPLNEEDTQLPKGASQLAEAQKERDKAIDLLETMFSSYENGTACYEDPEDCSGFVGYAFKMDDSDFNACCDLLNRTRPRAAIGEGEPT